MKNTAVLLVSCPDQKGLVAAIADFLLAQDANILHADQHQDAELRLFLMRVDLRLSFEIPRWLSALLSSASTALIPFC